MKKGELHREKTENGDIYICRQFNPEKMEATGTWRGSINDLELLRQQEKISLIQGRLESMAREGLKTRIHLPSLVRDSVNQIVSEMTSHIERKMIYKGEYIEKVVNQTIKKYEEEPVEKTK
ncbi:hypothetical protein [Methanonatronarchaeum sp. AMET6-2]|uniref:hypothetical protein n=1 Tax=Methanonatronarchaeum sp. AMET6-2 TaxID=2933293 RepID=UPI001211F675|nr:hypothetical protein [Methanonatronarchaeum sp. AMET6-2]RZN60859.1 MAG: hypothetical protein EF811_06080 [Methanonatronarchaeia archaeon]UOY09558.1 hypothetical protein MU439_04710 [Methanonatronarchaeum sp. AMET6-2]